MNEDELNLVTLAQRFSDPEAARTYLEELRWPGGVPVCPFCGSEGGRLNRQPSGKRKAQKGVCKCKNKECRKQFTVTKGTVFESSHVNISLWMMCMFIMCASKKGVSAHQIHRMLHVTYKTAWFMCHRIRYAMNEGPLSELLGGIVEVDETYVGGKARGHKNAFTRKACVVGLVERGPKGRKRSVMVDRVTGKNLRAAIREHTAQSAEIHTDSYVGYSRVFMRQHHETVNHEKKEYARVRKDGTLVTTNTAEASFAIIKRAVYGTFHHVSKRHLHRYLSEFDFKWNTCKDSDGERTHAALSMIEGKRLLYRDSLAANTNPA